MHSFSEAVAAVSADIENVELPAIGSELETGRLMGLSLHEHQLSGIQWMLRRWEAKRSIIVADEMGLGKTLQTLAFIAYLMDHRNMLPPVLIIAPLSVAPQWLSQARQFIPSLRVFEYFGTAEVREEKRRWIIEDHIMHLSSSVDPQPLPFDIMVSTYETCLLDIGFVGKFLWRICVFDEGHRLKNEASVTHQTLLNGLQGSAFKIILTGTPVQNNFGEFWALLHFLDPIFFSDRVETPPDLQIVSTVVNSLVLRRLTAETSIVLPAMENHIVRVKMTEIQKNLYKWAIYQNFHGEKSSLMMPLRKIASHPYLIPGVEPEPFVEGDHLFTSSNKFVELDGLLNKMKAENGRALIFSTLTTLLDICQDFLDLKKFSYQRLDGSVRGEERTQTLVQWGSETDTSVFLLSTRAGGVGLNLATANWVIFLDSDWNPQMDLQAIARAFRQGQTKTVKVFRLVSEHTIDELILERAERKLLLTRQVLHEESPVDATDEFSDDYKKFEKYDGESWLPEFEVFADLGKKAKPAPQSAQAPLKSEIRRLTEENRLRKKIQTWAEIGYVSTKIEPRILLVQPLQCGSLIHLHGSVVEPVAAGGTRVVCHCVDTSGSWPNHGLFLAIQTKFPTVATLYAKSKTANDLRFGDTHVFSTGSDLFVALLVARDPTQFKTCLCTLSSHFTGSTTFHFSRIGDKQNTLYVTERLIKRYICETGGFDAYMYYYTGPRTDPPPTGTGTGNASNSHTEAPHTGSVHAGGVCTGDEHAGDAHLGDEPTGDEPTVDAHTGGVHTGDAHTGGVRTEDAHTGKAHMGDAHTGDQPTVDAHTGGLHTGDAHTDGVYIGDARVRRTLFDYFKTAPRVVPVAPPSIKLTYWISPRIPPSIAACYQREVVVLGGTVNPNAADVYVLSITESVSEFSKNLLQYDKCVETSFPSNSRRNKTLWIINSEHFECFVSDEMRSRI